jgi:hypothetical protein
MLATGWHGGNAASPHDPAGYGIKFSIADRDAFFEETWTHAVLELDVMRDPARNWDCYRGSCRSREALRRTMSATLDLQLDHEGRLH